MVKPSDFDRFHQEFLSLHCHWDLARQMYVREDGSFFQDPPANSTPIRFEFKNVPQLDLRVVLSRIRHNSLQFSLITTESGDAKMGVGILSFQDASNGQEVGWATVNQEPGGLYHKDHYLALPPHAPKMKDWNLESGFRLDQGHRLRLKLELDGKSYFSPVYRP